MARARTAVASLASLASLVALAACRRSPPDPATAPTDAGAAKDAAAVTDASDRASVTDAGAVEGGAAPLAPLAWGTRPTAGELELYPALDGPCTLSVSALVDATAIIVGGTSVLLATPDGFDLRNARLPEGNPDEVLPSGLAAVGGRKDALWVEQSFFPTLAAVHLRRPGEGWKAAAPVGAESRSYRAPEPFRGGALGVVLDYSGGAGEPWHRLLGYDLPKDVTPAKLLPANVRPQRLWALAEGDLLVLGATPNGVTQPIFLLPADGGAAQKIDTSVLRTPDAALEGRTRASFRVVAGDKRFRLEGQALVPEEVENSPVWRVHGDVVQHLVGAGYREAPLPTLPITGAAADPDAITVAFDGEVFVTARWGPPENRSAALYRSRRPREVLRCTEVGVDREGDTARAPEGFGPATMSGVEPWPPPADAACKTPFVVAKRWRERHKVPSDLPALRAALAKVDHDAVLEDVLSGTRHVVGARAKALDQAKALAKAIARVVGEPPEIVCADPEPGRVIGADAGAR
jgi:hypothetical protein